MFDRLFRLIPIEIRATPEGELKAKVLILTSMTFATITLSGFTFLIIFIRQVAIRLAPALITATLICFFCLATPWLLNRTRSLFYAALPILIAFVSVSVISGFGYGGITAPVVPLILFLPIVTQFFGSSKASTYSCILAITILITLRIFEHYEWVGLSALTTSMKSTFEVVVYCCTTLLTYFLAQGYERSRKETERYLLQLTRSASLGLISGGFAHEVNSPLATISLSADAIDAMLKNGKINDADLEKISSRIRRSTNKISMITKTILANSKEDKEPSFQSCNVQKIATQTSTLCEDRIAEAGIQFIIEPSLEQIQFQCRPVQITQALFNIVYNSIEAISALNEKWIRISGKSYSDSIEIIVTDSGHGISKNIQAKLFTPFFTTKDVGFGYGLGLANCASTILLHHGQVYYDDTKVNTTFVIRLPKTQPN